MEFKQKQIIPQPIRNFWGMKRMQFKGYYLVSLPERRRIYFCLEGDKLYTMV
jgi:hypothetical protein